MKGSRLQAVRRSPKEEAVAAGSMAVGRGAGVLKTEAAASRVQQQMQQRRRQQ